MKTLKDVLADGEKHFISLNKLTGKKVADIEVTLSTEYGDPCIHLFRVRFDDGTSAFVEGEHDFAYLDNLCGVSQEEVTALYKEGRE